jgi:hypothetical protein
MRLRLHQAFLTHRPLDLARNGLLSGKTALLFPFKLFVGLLFFAEQRKLLEADLPISIL